MTRDDANNLFAYHRARPSAATKAYDPIAAALENRARQMEFLDSFGLRIASLYARYFGGELSLMPMEGHGVDAYIYMNCLTEDSTLKGTSSSSSSRSSSSKEE